MNRTTQTRPNEPLLGSVTARRFGRCVPSSIVTRLLVVAGLLFGIGSVAPVGVTWLSGIFP